MQTGIVIIIISTLLLKTKYAYCIVVVVDSKIKYILTIRIIISTSIINTYQTNIFTNLLVVVIVSINICCKNML